MTLPVGLPGAAFIHIGFNCVPLRFTAFFVGSVTLGVLWVRFAAQTL